jgi:L-ascorbate metabolism protein UlaG (beta-lactamase superfamily)
MKDNVRFSLRPLVVSLVAFGLALPLVAQETKVQWLGHAAFAVTTPRGKVLLIDPWINNAANPAAGEGKDASAAIEKADLIFLTHGHRDHVGDAVAIARRTGAQLVSNPELAANLVRLNDFPAKQTEVGIMGIGGEISLLDGEVRVAMTPAVHSSSVFDPKAGAGEADRAYGGNPAGFVIMVKNGPAIYHSGDTAYFGDMELIGEYAIDVALLNIGGHFGMEPPMAARAAKSVRAKLAVPHHFGTFPGITANTKSFAAALAKERIAMREMKAGETIVFKGKQLVK